jgi:hypothetical protein
MLGSGVAKLFETDGEDMLAGVKQLWFLTSPPVVFFLVDLKFENVDRGNLECDW